jgi:peptidoglycan/xylan/chitin deacetylase (PgdA/CDA1 family)
MLTLSIGGARTVVSRWLPSPLLRASALVHVAALAAAAGGRWRWALAAVVADHAILAAAGLAPRSTLLGPVLRRLPAAAADRGEVGLTFDDGPDPETTPRVFDLLAAAGCRASFFPIGRRAARHPDLVRQAALGGHAVENHTYHHRAHFAFLGPRALLREVGRAQSLIAGLTGRPPTWFRPPAGMRNPWLGPLVAGRGLHLASWSRRGFDTVERDPARVARRLARELAAGDVLLLHDGSSARGAGGRPVVLDALPAVLAALRDRGLHGVELPAEAR